MKCQSLFTGKNKKNVSNCRLLEYIPSMLRVKFFFCFFLQ